MCVCERYLVIPSVAELNRCPTGVLIWQSTHVSRCKKHYSGANSDAWKRANNTFLKNTAALGWSLNCVLLHYCKSLISRRMPLKSPKLWIFNTGMWENYEANIFQGKFWMHSQGIMILSQSLISWFPATMLLLYSVHYETEAWNTKIWFTSSAKKWYVSQCNNPLPMAQPHH